MVCIWSGNMTSVSDITKLEAILDNLHTWAMRVLRPWISQHIDCWAARHLDEKGELRDVPDGYSMGNSKSTTTQEQLLSGQSASSSSHKSDYSPSPTPGSTDSSSLYESAVERFSVGSHRKENADSSDVDVVETPSKPATARRKAALSRGSKVRSASDVLDASPDDQTKDGDAPRSPRTDSPGYVGLTETSHRSRLPLASRRMSSADSEENNGKRMQNEKRPQAVRAPSVKSPASKTGQTDHPTSTAKARKPTGRTVQSHELGNPTTLALRSANNQPPPTENSKQSSRGNETETSPNNTPSRISEYAVDT